MFVTFLLILSGRTMIFYSRGIRKVVGGEGGAKIKFFTFKTFKIQYNLFLLAV